jgi:hypothetical protein
LPSLEEDERDFETEERWPVNTAVSKINASIARCLPMSHAAPALSKSRMVPPATGENMPKPAPPLVAILPARHGIRPTSPVVRDKMPVETGREQSHASYPNMASPGHILSFPLKADTSKRHIALSVAAENKRSVSSPDTWTAPALSESVPVRLSQACSVSLPQREETRQHVNGVVFKKTRMDLPASREAIPQWLECSDEHSQPTPELVLQAQEAIPSAFAVDNKRDTVGNISSCSDSPDAPQCIPYPFVLPMLPDPEPKASPWAQPSDSIRPPDMSLEKDSKRPAVGYPNSTQAGLETAAKQSPEPQLVDSLAALIRVHLAG